MTLFDYVVVGGGTAGCALAGRLSEQPGVSVCLVEAGPDFTESDRPPAFRSPWGEPVVESEFFWAYQARFHREHEVPTFTIRGRVTGGSSAINGAEWVRGIAEDYDSWGSDLWRFDRVLESFKRAETDHDFDGAAHGRSGPIPVRRHPRDVWHPVHDAFYAASVARGFAEKRDINESAGSGVSPTPMNVDTDGTRVDAARAYLEPARGRENLTIVSNAVVTRILWNGTTARGVEYDSDGATGTVEGGEVILAAGALGSPHLLMVSGVGPADELRALGIEVVADVPGVGRNLQDHPSIMLNVQLGDAADLSQIGPSSPVIVAYTAEGSTQRNDMVLTLPWYRGDGFMTEILGLACRLNAPVARGHMELQSADVNDAPNLEYCYLEDEEDCRRMREAVRHVVAIAQQSPFAGYLAGVEAPDRDELADDRMLDAWLARNISSTLHSAGTCKLGPESDPGAVVDERCRVCGVDGLRVADLSIAPTVPRSNTGSTAIMIGEHLADLIGKEGQEG